MLLVLAIASLAARTASAFELEDVARRARQLAQEPFHDPRGQVPDWLLKLTYDQWRDIRYRPDDALWHDRRLPFEVQFFHPGSYHNRIVTVNVVDVAVWPVPPVVALVVDGQTVVLLVADKVVPEHLHHQGPVLLAPVPMEVLDSHPGTTSQQGDELDHIGS